MENKNLKNKQRILLIHFEIEQERLKINIWQIEIDQYPFSVALMIDP